jgi:hypothetical protein
MGCVVLRTLDRLYGVCHRLNRLPILLGVGELIARWADEHSFEVCLGGNFSRVSVTSDALLHYTGDALLAFLLPIAMATGSRLVIEDEIDERLLRSQARIQEILSFWKPLKLRRGSVDAPTVARQPRPNISSFFSGGVDSTYTALQHRSELTQLVLVHGFDTRADQAVLRPEISQRLGRAAHTLGIPLVEISTTLRDLSDRFMGWYDYHGAALAGIAHMLDSGVFLSILPPTLIRMVSRRVCVRSRIHCGARVPFMSSMTAQMPPVQERSPRQSATNEPSVGYVSATRMPIRLTTAEGMRSVCANHAFPCMGWGRLNKQRPFPNNVEPRAVRKLRFHNRASLAFARENLQILKGSYRHALWTAYRASAGKRMTALGLDRLPSEVRHGANLRYASCGRGQGLSDPFAPAPELGEMMIAKSGRNGTHTYVPTVEAENR